ncbi:unnamed protein product [Caenorhabditis angaria]|uniref:Cathepsin propeptide inhibitor domain-containing protein n=1 Tax=Caenorhabditis angaria TaxID=860376 RepID=A0A9P1IG19_9PELO|nr:unnamed protein product [Caenorhabditis angaria]
MRTLILFLVFCQLVFSDPPNPRREALNFLTALHKLYSLHDSSILHAEFEAVWKNGTTASREKTVHYINNLNAHQIEHHQNLTKKFSQATIEDTDSMWKHQHHVARFGKDQSLEIERNKHQVLQTKIVAKPDATIEGGYKFYRFFIYY